MPEFIPVSRQNEQQSGVPEVTLINGVPHMLAYINRAEKDMLRREGASGLPGPGGIPAYGLWADTFGGGNSFTQSVANAFTPNDNKQYVGGQLTYGGARDADMYAGSSYSRNIGGGYSSPNSVSLSDYTSGNYTSTPQPGGGSVITAGGGNYESPPQSGVDPATERAMQYDQARRRRDAALKKQQSALADAFGFATDDYFSGLADTYEADNNSAFQSAYDSALRGIYEGFKSKGLVTQASLADAMSGLNAAEGEERTALGNAADEYAKANRAYVEQGRTDLGNQLAALAEGGGPTVADMDAQTAAINDFDIQEFIKPYMKPTGTGAADFFSDFYKVANNPSFNVAPTATASGDPSRVSESVRQYGANRQPSSMVGIRSPYEGQAMRVVG